MKKLLQKDLAYMAGISDAYLSQILHGHRNVSARVAKKLADFTGVSPLVWLYGSTDEKKSAIEQANNNGGGINDDTPREEVAGA